MKKELLLTCSLLLASPLAPASTAECLNGERLYSVKDFVRTATSEATANHGVRPESPQLSISSDDSFDIFSISLPFSGETRVMEESAFSANYTFTMPGGTLIEAVPSADDSLTVGTTGITTSAIWTPEEGSAVTESSSGKIPAIGEITVSGTYNNVVGPHAMMLSVKAKQEKPMIRKVSVKNNSGSKLLYYDAEDKHWRELCNIQAPPPYTIETAHSKNPSLCKWKKELRTSRKGHANPFRIFSEAEESIIPKNFQLKKKLVYKKILKRRGYSEDDIKQAFSDKKNFKDEGESNISEPFSFFPFQCDDLQTRFDFSHQA